MKKLLLALAAVCVAAGSATAATPTIDGTFDGTGIWGSPVATDGGSDGWAFVDATDLYVTEDATYIYLGASCSHASWQNWGFAINTTSGGGNTQDPWGYQLIFSYPSAPDYAVRGVCDNTYRELRVWDGSDWDAGGGVNLGASESNSSPGNSWIEVRVPKASLGNPGSIDVAFLMSGNNSGEHGCFDQIPSGTGDTTANDWNESGSDNVLNGMALGITVPVEVSKFSID